MVRTALFLCLVAALPAAAQTVTVTRAAEVPALTEGPTVDRDGNVYTAITDQPFTNEVQNTTVRRHRPDGTLAWSKLGYFVYSMAADATGVYLVTREPSGDRFAFFVRKLDAATWILRYDKGFFADNTRIALTRFGHDPDTKHPGTTVTSDRIWGTS